VFIQLRHMLRAHYVTAVCSLDVCHSKRVRQQRTVGMGTCASAFVVLLLSWYRFCDRTSHMHPYLIDSMLYLLTPAV
jgi:hypothetical protein